MSEPQAKIGFVGSKPRSSGSRRRLNASSHRTPSPSLSRPLPATEEKAVESVTECGNSAEIVSTERSQKESVKERTLDLKHTEDAEIDSATKREEGESTEEGKSGDTNGRDGEGEKSPPLSSEAPIQPAMKRVKESEGQKRPQRNRGESILVPEEDAVKCKSEIYEWGSGAKILSQPRLLWGKRVRQIVCGGGHAAALLVKGGLYVWGDGRNGQLGLGPDVKHVAEPELVPSMQCRARRTVEKVWCGYVQTAVRTVEDQLFVWGYDSFKGPVWTPELISSTANERVEDISFGPTCTAMIVVPDVRSLRKSVYGPLGMSEVRIWGTSSRGLLGLGKDVHEQKTPRTIPALAAKGVVKISLGEYHAACCTTKGEVYVWGTNKSLCLGVGRRETAWKPEQVKFSSNIYIVDVHCGSNFTIAVGDQGEVYTWGRGRHGVLGHGTEKDAEVPKKVAMLPPVRGVATGGMHTFAWTATNRVFCWGDGRAYKLGQDNQDDCLSPEPVDAISKDKIVHSICCGFDRTLAYLETDVVAVTYRNQTQSIPVTPDTTVADILDKMVRFHHLQAQDVRLINRRGVELNPAKPLHEQETLGRLIVVKTLCHWDEESEDLIFDKTAPPGPVPTVAAGTPDKLVEWLTFPVATGFQYSFTFMTMHPNFIGSKDLLKKLMDRWDDPQFPVNTHETLERATMRIIRLRVLNVIKKWIQEHGSDDFFQGEEGVLIVEKLWTFIENKAMKEFPREAAGLRRQLISKLESYDDRVTHALTKGPMVPHRRLDDAPPADPVEHTGPMDIFKYSAREMARQFTLIDFYEFLEKIKPREFIGQAWSKGTRHERAPNIILMISRFNNVSQWVAAEILRGETHAIRVKKTERFIDIASQARRLHNFNLVMCFISAFTSTPIHRLKSLWGENGISADHAEQLHFLRTLMSMDSNMSAYREYYENVIPPKIPFIGIHLRDYTFLDDANPRFLKEDPRLVNFLKCHKLFATVSQVLDLQKARYLLRPIPEVAQFLMAACGFENHDRAAFNFSQMIENSDGVHSGETELVPPPVLSDDISKLYKMHKNVVRDEGPEIRLLNQRVGIMLAQVSAETDTADRKRLWKTLNDKLFSKSPPSDTVVKSNLGRTLRQSNMRLSRVRTASIGLDFKEILLGSRAVSASILSALIRFPEGEELESFRGILSGTLMPFVDIDQLVDVLAGLSQCKLLHEQSVFVAELLSNYKSVDRGSRRQVLEDAKKRLGPLKEKAKQDILRLETSRKRGERKGTIFQNVECSDTNVQLITCYHTVVKLTQELLGDYQKAINGMNDPRVEELSTNLLDVNLNASIRLSKAEEEKSDLMRQGELELQEISNILHREEARAESLGVEEEELLSELARIDEELLVAQEEADACLHYETFLEDCVQYDVDQYEKEITVYDDLIADYSAVSKTLQALDNVFQKVGHSWKVTVSQVQQEIDAILSAATQIIEDLLKKQTSMCTFVLATSRKLKSLAKASKASQQLDDLHASLEEARSLMDCQPEILVILESLEEFKDCSEEEVAEAAASLSTKLLRLYQLISQVSILHRKFAEL